MSHPASLQDLLKAHQTINSQHFLSLLCSSALISVRAASRCCGNHLLGDSVWIYSVNQNASLQSWLLDRFLIPNKWQRYLIYVPWERHTAAWKMITVLASLSYLSFVSARYAAKISLCQKSTYHERNPPVWPLSAPPFLFSLCGVEGIGALPQVAGATDAVAASLVRRKCKEREGRYGATAAVQSSPATCGWKNCFIYFPLPLSPPPPPLGEC